LQWFSLHFCVGLDHFGFVLSNFILLALVFFQYRSKRLAEKNVSENELLCFECDVKPYSVQCHHIRFGDVAEMLVRGLMKKHEDHVRVLESLVCNQQTLVQLKDAKIEELEDAKHQLHYHLAKLQDHQLFFNVTIFY